MKKKMSRRKKVLVISLFMILFVLILFFGFSFMAFNYLFGDLKVNQFNKNDTQLGISQEIEDKQENTKIMNIALFGVDSRNEESFKGRSDSIMILSVDKKANSLKLTSILRDSEVLIDGHGKSKITHAYSYGGPELAVKTLNQNFKLDIREYATINFEGLSKVIDMLNGIDIQITEAEKQQINQSCDGQDLQNAGNVHLNGQQALAYSRIRYIDSDTKRANRQRNVLEAMFTKVKTMSPTQYPSLLKSIMSLVETSLQYDEILSYAPMMLKEVTLEQNYIPNQQDNPVGGGNPWVWKFDVNASADRLHKFIYGE